MEIERLARGDSIDQGIVTRTFQYSHTRIITPYKVYEPGNDFDLEYFEFSLFMSRREYKTINRRMQSGRLASIKEGKYVGNIAPYGYDRIRLSDRKGFTLFPNHEAPAVRLIFSLYGEKALSIPEIVLELNNSQTYHPRKASVFTYSSIHDILDNPVYIGKLRWNYRRTAPKLKDGVLTSHRPRQSDYLLVQGLHPALISEDLFFTVQNTTPSGFGAEELAHMEMICAIVHQLTRNLTPEEIERSGFANYYVDHTLALWPQAASGMPWTATVFQSKGDPITDLHENLAAEQKARTTYDNILRLVDDPDIIAPIRFLREREIVHYQRFGESLRIVTDHLDSKNFYAFNPSFDNPSCRS